MSGPYLYIPVVSDLWRAFKRATLSKLFYGRSRECPLCGGTFSRWVRRKDVGTCPRCSCLARDRVIVLHLSEKELQGKSLLYFAPNWGMLNWLKRVPGLITRTTDLLDSSVDFKADICDLPMKVESYDFIICSHVLEHVPDDKKAISELCRVLKFGGIALVQFPYDDAAEKTDEDPLVEDPAERKKRWGQFDHVRLYGQDVRSRFEEAGFQVSLRRPYREIGQDKGLRYGLWDDVLFELIKVGEAP